MLFTLESTVSTRLKEMFGPGPALRLPVSQAAATPPIDILITCSQVGDVQGRRKVINGSFAAIAEKAPASTFPDVTHLDFITEARDCHQIHLRWFTKAHAEPPGSAVLYIHGGGMIAGSVEMWDGIIKNYVEKTGIPFLAVEYRLAPEFMAPIPVTDTFAGLKFLLDHANELHVDPRRIAIMGDSAGGGIAASLAHYVKQNGGPSICNQILIYPMLDDRNTTSDPLLESFAFWTADDNRTAWGALLGDALGSDNVTPIHAAGRMTTEEAAGLPPAYIDFGELDIFRDESYEYARKLGKAGVSVTLHVYPGLPHGFEAFSFGTPIGDFAMEQRYKYLKGI
jgi:acetyl esterase/lipase